MSADLLELRIGAIAHGGHCVARHEGRVVFVRHALPGELVRARLTEAGDSARMWRADAVEILEPSEDRVASAWPEAGPGGVGGGELAHVALPAQRRWKHAVLTESFTRFAGEEFPGEVHAAPGDDARAGLAWRTRVEAVADAEGRAAMHLHRSREVRALAAMPLALPAVEAALLEGRFPEGKRITVVQPSDGEVQIVVDGLPWRKGRADKRPNAPRTVRERVTVDGSTWEYRLDVEAFWQVHREAPALLVDQVLSRVGDAAAVADLYAGAGLFAVPLAATGRQVVAVESDAKGARAARRNAHALPGVSVIEGDVRRTLAAGIVPVDAIVLDPPRSGAGAKTLDQVAAAGAARLVYVACDPVALARDVALLRERGYALEEAQAFDLFPMTHHVETVATFVRR